MKNLKYTSLLAAALMALSCEQEVPELKVVEETIETPTGSPGSLNLTKFVTLGNSLVAGFRSNALFTEGQEESLGKILAKQFSYAGGSATFNQPDINSANGFSGLSGATPLGRLILFDPDGSGPRSASPTASGTPARTATCPATVETPAMPAPYNSADVPTPFTGNKAALNNFGVPGILAVQALIKETGGPSSPANPAFNALYARFASNPGTSTILADAVAAQPTFFLIEIGNNDVLGYATSGALQPGDPGFVPMTTIGGAPGVGTGFQATMGAIVNSFLAVPNSKGVIANIPDVTSIPYFITVPWNAISLAQTNVDALTPLATNYNTLLETLKGLGVLTQAEVDKRKLTFSVGTGKPILITDETLTDLTPYMTGPAAALRPYARARQTTKDDIITLPAGGVLGTCAVPPGGAEPSASFIWGVSAPLSDRFVLIPSETQAIRTRVAEFNSVIANLVAANPDRLALADINAKLNQLVANRGSLEDGFLLTPSITPPYAGFSEDGVHPNGRGYAFLANVFIDAINAKFGATIPKANVNLYSGNRTPVSPTSSY